MLRMIAMNLLILLAGTFLNSCSKDSSSPEINNLEKKEYVSSFETVDDFSGFYLTPQGYLGTSFHELSDSIVHSGSFAHKAWINGSNPPSVTTNNNHRGYPTIQLQNTSDGVFKTPCYVTLWVWLDMELQENTTGGIDDWFSFATFTDDESDNWNESVLVNLSHDGFVHLMHVPSQGQQEYIFQTSSITFPQKEWVELKIYLDFSEEGYVKVWQNGELVSHALVDKNTESLSQAHFGMYSPPQMISGLIYNDDLLIQEVDGE